MKAPAKQTAARRGAAGFCLIEVLLVLAIISIMAALVINAFCNAAQDRAHGRTAQPCFARSGFVPARRATPTTPTITIATEII